MSLNQYFWTNTGLPINKWLHYLPIYERFFESWRNRRIFFLEIGSGQGGSSRMWKHYFGPLAQIVTIDIRPECKTFQDEQVAVRIGSQADPQFLQSIIDEFGAPDIVLDDGSHIMSHVNATFDYLYLKQPREAVYMVEDTHTAYWPSWEGGLRKPGTFIERMKVLVDELHGDNPHHATQAAEPIPTSEVAAVTRSVSFFKSIVVLEKGASIVTSERSIPYVAGGTIW
jgi:hypothetical protein